MDNIEEVYQDDTSEPLEIKLSIDSANVESKTTCPFCNCVVLCNQDIPTVRCSSCFRKFKTINLLSQLTVTISCANIEYLVKKDILSAFFKNLSKMTNDEIEDSLLLETDALVIDRNVVKLVKADDI